MELGHWLDALVDTGLIDGWHRSFGFEDTPSYVIDGKVYSYENAVKLVRDFEVGANAA